MDGAPDRWPSRDTRSGRRGVSIRAASFSVTTARPGSVRFGAVASAARAQGDVACPQQHWHEQIWQVWRSPARPGTAPAVAEDRADRPNRELGVSVTAEE